MEEAAAVAAIEADKARKHQLKRAQLEADRAESLATIASNEKVELEKQKAKQE